jgi:hypothetical protein
MCYSLSRDPNAHHRGAHISIHVPPDRLLTLPRITLTYIPIEYGKLIVEENLRILFLQ